MQTFLSGHIPLGSQKSSNSNKGKANEIVVSFLMIECIFIPSQQLIKPLFIVICNYVYYELNMILLCYNVKLKENSYIPYYFALDTPNTIAKDERIYS